MVNKATVDTGDTSSSRDLHSKLNGPIRADNRMTTSSMDKHATPQTGNCKGLSWYSNACKLI